MGEKRGEKKRKEREGKVGEKTGKRLCACVQCGPAWFTTQDPDPVLTVQSMPVSSQWKQLEAYDIVQSNPDAKNSTALAGRILSSFRQT